MSCDCHGVQGPRGHRADAVATPGATGISNTPRWRSGANSNIADIPWFSSHSRNAVMSRAAEHGARVFALVWSQNSSVDDEHDAAGGGALGAPPDVEIAAAARGAADDDATQAASVRCYACGREGAWAVRCTTMHAACTHNRARAAKQTQSSASVPPSSTAPSRARVVTGDVHDACT